MLKDAFRAICCCRLEDMKYTVVRFAKLHELKIPKYIDDPFEIDTELINEKRWLIVRRGGFSIKMILRQKHGLSSS